MYAKIRQAPEGSPQATISRLVSEYNPYSNWRWVEGEGWCTTISMAEDALFTIDAGVRRLQPTTPLEDRLLVVAARLEALGCSVDLMEE